MEYYLNFSFVGESDRFHVLLPYRNLNLANFNIFESHLKSIMLPEFYERTRKLKLSGEAPESGTIEFHRWLRQQPNREIT
jgi:hypothetical protein